jgi:hypothetical protein
MITAVLFQKATVQRVDHVHHEGLFVQRIGVAGMGILVRLRLEEADRSQISRRQRVEEVVGVVLMVGASVRESDGRWLVGRVWVRLRVLA